MLTKRKDYLLKPGGKPGGWKRPAPQLPVQKTFRATADFLEKVEERALEESIRTGVTVRFSDLVRRGLQAILDSELPPYVRGKRLPCALVRTSLGTLACMECKVNGGERKGSLFCTRLSREVSLDD